MQSKRIWRSLISTALATTTLMVSNRAEAFLMRSDTNSPESYLKFIKNYKTDSTGYLISFDPTDLSYSVCTGTVISSQWLLTAGHCHDNLERFGGIFVNENGVIRADAFVLNPGYNGGPVSDTTPNAFGFYQNNLNAVAADLALVHLTKNAYTLGMKRSTIATSSAPSEFNGRFVGFGRQGTGDSGPKPGTLLSDVKKAIETTKAVPKDAVLTKAAVNNRSGGENIFYSVRGDNSIYASDFDGPLSKYNVDFRPSLPFEATSQGGDSGAGIFDSNGVLQAIISGGGYGNKAPNISNPPDRYGELQFAVGVASPVNAKWIAGARSANKDKIFKTKKYVAPANAAYKARILPRGLRSFGDLEIPADIISEFGEVIVEPYGENMDDTTFNQILASLADPNEFIEVFGNDDSQNVESVPEPTTVIGSVFAFGLAILTSRKRSQD